MTRNNLKETIKAFFSMYVIAVTYTSGTFILHALTRKENREAMLKILREGLTPIEGCSAAGFDLKNTEIHQYLTSEEDLRNFFRGLRYDNCRPGIHHILRNRRMFFISLLLDHDVCVCNMGGKFIVELFDEERGEFANKSYSIF